MRHLAKGKSLGVNPSHRRAMLRNLVTSLLVHEKIETTLARAKEMRRYVDKMITLGKRGDLNARRHAMRFVKGKKAPAILFGELALRYKSRAGGYSRVLPTGVRRGDSASMAISVLVDSPKDPFSNIEHPKDKQSAKASAGKDKTGKVNASKDNASKDNVDK